LVKAALSASNFAQPELRLVIQLGWAERFPYLGEPPASSRHSAKGPTARQPGYYAALLVAIAGLVSAVIGWQP
jgi:hypothetical protein